MHFPLKILLHMGLISSLKHALVKQAILQPTTLQYEVEPSLPTETVPPEDQTPCKSTRKKRRKT